MRIELWIMLVTALFVINAYYDNYVFSIYQKNRKYIQIVIYIGIGLSIYYFFKTNPKQSKDMVYHASNVLKYLPIDKTATTLINPMLHMCDDTQETSVQKIMNSGKGTKRSVSETKKKWVASQQSWKCASCQESLPAWFEVDHVKRLADGGTNDVDNLVAYCRSCHGRKTMMESF